jgi:hypothetical protein
MAPQSYFCSTIPTTLYNTWHKMVRYRHHHNFLNLCIKKQRIPKGLTLNLNLQLDKNNATLDNTCKLHLQRASFDILKDISTASLAKTKELQRKLETEREKLFNVNGTFTANRIWKLAKNIMFSIESKLKREEHFKLSKASHYVLPEPESTDTNTDKQQPRKRRYRRKLRKCRNKQHIYDHNEPTSVEEL